MFTTHKVLCKILFLYAIEKLLKISYFHVYQFNSVCGNLQTPKDKDTLYLDQSCFLVLVFFPSLHSVGLEHSTDPKRSQHAGYLVSNQRITLPSVHSTASCVLPCSRENKCECNVIHDLRKGSHQTNRDK